MYKNLFKTFLIAGFFAMPIAITAEENKAAIELANVPNSFRDKAISTYIQGTIHYIPEIKKHEALFKDFFDRHMDVESYKAEVIKRLSEEFNEQELKELADFYGSKRKSMPATELMEYTSKIRPLFDRLNLLYNQVTKEAFDRAMDHKPELLSAIRQAVVNERS